MLDGFVMQRQERDQWCWAAVAVSIATFYDRATRWSSQCAVANSHLQRTDCCGGTSLCNEANFVEYVLQTIGLYKHWHNGTKSFDDVCAQIDAGNPVVCRIAWHGGGGHFVVITGYDRGNETVVVDDPLFNRSTLAYDVLCNAYLGMGRWADTSETTPPPRESRKRRAVGHR